MASGLFLEPDSYAFTAHAVPGLVAATLSLFLGAAVLAREGRSRPSGSFLGLCLLVSLWLGAFSAMLLAEEDATALRWARVGYLAIPLIPAAAYTFVVRLLELERERRVALAAAWILCGASVPVFLWSDWFLTGLIAYPWGRFARLGPWSGLFVGPLVGFLTLSVAELARAYRAAEPGTPRLRARAFLVSFSLGSLAVFDVLPALGVAVYPVGFLPIFAFLLGSAWAAWRHRLADLGPAFIAEKLFQAIPDLVLVCDRTGKILHANRAAGTLLGYEAGELRGVSIERLAQGPLDREALEGALGAAAAEREVVLRRRDGAAVEASVSASDLHDQNGFSVGRVLVARDITETRILQEALFRSALYDPVTGLPNRVLFLDRVERALAHSRSRAVPFALLHLELEGVPQAVETLGIEARQALLEGAARRLNAIVREADTLARTGSEEFGILLRHITDSGHAMRMALRIQERMAAPFRVTGEEVYLRTAIGIALSAPESGGPEELVRDARAALARARDGAPDRVEVFDASMREEARARVRLEREIRRAIEHEEFELAYQPIVSLEDGEPLACEALLRWRHPERGLLLPQEFLAVAEEMGVLPPLGWWVLERAVPRVAGWRAAASRPLRLHVNVSGRELAHPALPARVAAALEDGGLAGGDLVLEMTEEGLRRHGASARRTMEALRGRGVRFCLDDVGTGYTSLAELRDLPLDILKVDRTFVAGLGRSDADAALVRAVRELGRALGLEVVAEGVETEEQRGILREMGYRRAQGHLFAEPGSPGEVEEYLRQDRAARGGSRGAGI